MFQFSLQDNGSAKYFQGAMHTSNMGEKVAQVSHVSPQIPVGFLCLLIISWSHELETDKATYDITAYRKVG